MIFSSLMMKQDCAYVAVLPSGIKDTTMLLAILIRELHLRSTEFDKALTLQFVFLVEGSPNNDN